MKNKKTLKSVSLLILVILVCQGNLLIASAQNEDMDNCIKEKYDKCIADAQKKYEASAKECEDKKTTDLAKCDNSTQPGTNPNKTCKNNVQSAYETCFNNATSYYNSLIEDCQNYQKGKYKTECEKEITKKKEQEKGILIDPLLQPSNLPGLPSTSEIIETESGQTVEVEKAHLPINAILQQIAGALLMLSGGIAVIVMAIGGIMYVTSHGNQQQMEKAKNTLVYGVVGSVAIIFSYLIISFVLQLIFGLG